MYSLPGLIKIKYMKLMIISDIHGFTDPLQKVLDVFEKEKCSMILLLGDALYHGPRNAFDGSYDAAATAELLNHYSSKIVAVRGNCDSEVDQMVLDFPLMSDYHIVLDGERKIFMTHGHLYNRQSMPPLNKGDIFVSGHSHMAHLEESKGIFYFNPGSISLPRQNTVPSFGIYDSESLKILSLEGDVLEILRL